VRALVVSISNRAAAGVYSDTTGPLIAERLTAWGFDTDGPQVVPDGAPVGEALMAAVEASYDVVVTTGGTGIRRVRRLGKTWSDCSAPIEKPAMARLSRPTAIRYLASTSGITSRKSSVEGTVQY